MLEAQFGVFYCNQASLALEAEGPLGGKKVEPPSDFAVGKCNLLSQLPCLFTSLVVLPPLIFSFSF